MQRLKKISLFILGSLIIPAMAVFLTNIAFKTINFFSTSLFANLWGDYVITYVITPFLYQKELKKYIPNQHLLFATIFIIFWIFELLIQ